MIDYWHSLLSLKVAIIGDIKNSIIVLKPRESINVYFVDSDWSDNRISLSSLTNIHSMMRGIDVIYCLSTELFIKVDSLFWEIMRLRILVLLFILNTKNTSRAFDSLSHWVFCLFGCWHTVWIIISNSMNKVLTLHHLSNLCQQASENLNIFKIIC